MRMKRLWQAVLFVMLTVGAAWGAPAVTTQKIPDPIPADNGMVVVSIPVDNMPVEAAVAQARLLLSPGGVVMGDDRIRRLVVKDFPANIERIKAHLEHADVALPMVRMAVAFSAASGAHATQIGVDGAAVVNSNGNSRVYAQGTARSDRSNVAQQGTMSVVTMSGSEGVIAIGENVPLVYGQFFYDQALRRGYITPAVVFQSVSSGFGVVPTVLGGGEIMLKIYPRVTYLSPSGPGVVRFLDAATEVRVRDGQSVQIAGGSTDTQGVWGRILMTGSYGSTQSGAFVVTPSVMRDPYTK